MLIGQQRKGIIFIKTAIEITNVLKEIPFTTLEITEDVTRVAKKLIEMGILTQKSFDDCQHIGVAVINECDCIISWNFKHIVNVKTKKETLIQPFSRFPFLMRKMGLEVLSLLKKLIERGFLARHLKSVTKV